MKDTGRLQILAYVVGEDCPWRGAGVRVKAAQFYHCYRDCKENWADTTALPQERRHVRYDHRYTSVRTHDAINLCLLSAKQEDCLITVRILDDCATVIVATLFAELISRRLTGV